MKIPGDARVIQFYDSVGEVAIAARPRRDADWRVAGDCGYWTSQMLAAASPPVVLASFPQPTLEEVVGDAVAFQFYSKNRDLRPYLLVAATDDSQRRPWYCAGSFYGSLGQLEMGQDIDLSSVVPLVPRGKG